MKKLAFAAALFVAICAIGGLYLALTGPGHEYDLKYVLPIDTRLMPRQLSVPEVAGEGPPPETTLAATADAGAATGELDKKPFRFEDRRPLTPELRASE